MFLWFGQNFGIYFFPHHQYYNGYRWWECQNNSMKYMFVELW
jgi:hypothetical protein